MSENMLTINITRLEDRGCVAYKAFIVELKATVLAESMKDLFEAISFTMETIEETIRKPVHV